MSKSPLKIVAATEWLREYRVASVRPDLVARLTLAK